MPQRVLSCDVHCDAALAVLAAQWQVVVWSK